MGRLTAPLPVLVRTDAQELRPVAFGDLLSSVPFCFCLRDHDLFDIALVEVVELLVHPPEVIFLLFLVVEEHRFLRFHVQDERNQRRSLLANQAMFCRKQLQDFGVELVDDEVMLLQCRTKICVMYR